MQVSIFIVLACIPSVLSQESISVTTSLVTITPAPTPIAVPQAFIGYSTETALGAYTTWFCPAGQTWSQDGNYARCCVNDPYVECGIATACLSISLMIGPGSQQTWTCSGTGNQTVCVTGIVYPSIGATMGITNAQCWSSWDASNWNATRDISITSSFPQTTSMAAPITTTLSFATSTSYQTFSSSPSASDLSPSRGLPTDAIIGIAVVVVILVAIAIFLFIFVHNKRKQQMKTSHDTQTMSARQDPIPPSAFTRLTQELPGKPKQPPELANDYNSIPRMWPIKPQYPAQNGAANRSADSLSAESIRSAEGGVPV